MRDRATRTRRFDDHLERPRGKAKKSFGRISRVEILGTGDDAVTRFVILGDDSLLLPGEAGIEFNARHGDVTILGVDRFGPAAVHIKFLLRTQPDRKFPLRREMLRRLKNRFDPEGIPLPDQRCVAGER